jgi:serine/threonine protein kinase
VASILTPALILVLISISISIPRTRQVMHRPSEGSNLEVGNVRLPMRTKFVPAGIKQMGSDAYDMNAFEIITEFPQIGPWKTFHVREKVFRQELVLRCILKNQATPQEMHRARRQVYLQSRINHPQIEHLFMAWEDKTCLYLALEFGGGNTVASMMENRGGTLPEAEIIRALIVPLLKILTLMHHCGLVHGDLRPEIVTFDRGSKAFTLCGFIHVANVHVECLEKSSGRAAYLAPEALEGKGKDAKVGPGRLGITQALDIWALGVMLVQVRVSHTALRIVG